MAGRQGGEQPEGMEPLYYSAAVVIIAVIIWVKYGQSIIEFIIEIRKYELLFIYNVAFYLSSLFKLTGLIQLDTANIVNALVIDISTNPSSIEYAEVWSFLGVAGIYFLPVTFSVAIVLGYHLSFKNKLSEYCEVYDMKVLRTREQVHYPHTRIANIKNLVKVPIDDPSWGMSKQPLDYAKENKLLVRVIRERSPAVDLNRSRAEEIFSLQLGRSWTGLDCLRDYEKALFSVFAAKSNRSSEEADKMLCQLSKSAQGGVKKMNFSGVNQLLQTHVGSKEVGMAVSPHAYVYTVMISMLEMARTDGVIASSEFLWLKTVDRELWYVLNCVGRVAVFPEVGGVFAHWKIETKLRRPLKTPCVLEAVNALDEAVKSVLFNPDEEGYECQ